jgi:histidine triad (HIT) family protein
MEPTIFTRIINGEIPCHKIYEDDQTIVFLDIHPTQPGHSLVVTKRQIAQFTDLSKDEFLNIMDVAQKTAQHIQNVLKTPRVVLKIEGFDVPHVHVHLIPCANEGDSYREGREQEGPNHAALAEMAEKLAL